MAKKKTKSTIKRKKKPVTTKIVDLSEMKKFWNEKFQAFLEDEDYGEYFSELGEYLGSVSSKIKHVTIDAMLYFYKQFSNNFLEEFRDAAGNHAWYEIKVYSSPDENHFQLVVPYYVSYREDIDEEPEDIIIKMNASRTEPLIEFRGSICAYCGGKGRVEGWGIVDNNILNLKIKGKNEVKDVEAILNKS